MPGGYGSRVGTVYAHPIGQFDRTGRRAGQSDHLPDEDAGEPVVANLFRGVLLSTQQQRERVIRPVPPDVGAGGFDGVADSSLRGHGAGVDTGPDVHCDLHVSEFHRGGHPVDRYVGGAERRPQVVRVLADPGGGLVRLGQERCCVGAVLPTG